MVLCRLSFGRARGGQGPQGQGERDLRPRGAVDPSRFHRRPRTPRRPGQACLGIRGMSQRGRQEQGRKWTKLATKKIKADSLRETGTHQLACRLASPRVVARCGAKSLDDTELHCCIVKQWALNSGSWIVSKLTTDRIWRCELFLPLLFGWSHITEQ